MKKYISVISVFAIWLIYLLGLNPILEAFGIINWLHSLGQFSSLTSIIVQEIPIILILLLLNYFSGIKSFYLKLITGKNP